MRRCIFAAILVATVVAQLSAATLAGGFSKERLIDDTAREAAAAVQASIKSKLSHVAADGIDEIKLVSYATQVVAGTNLRISGQARLKGVTMADFVAVIFRSLPDRNTKVVKYSLTSVTVPPLVR